MAYYIKSAEDEFVIRCNEEFSKNKNPKNPLRKIIMLKFKKFPALGIIFSLENFDPDIGIESFTKCFKKIISIDEAYLRESIGINFLETGTYLRCIPSSETVDDLGFHYLGWEELNELYFDENKSDENVKLVCEEIIKASHLDGDIILNSDLGWASFVKDLYIIKNFINLNLDIDPVIIKKYKVKNENYLNIIKKNIGNSIKEAVFFLKNQKSDSFDIVPDLGIGILSASLRNYIERDRNSQVFETTPIEIPVGFMSAHKDAVMGRKGHAFLTGGSNNLIEQYDNKNEKDLTSEAWYSLLKIRNKKLSSLNSKFIQIIIPEKISVYPDLFPFEIRTPTNNLFELEKKLHEDDFYTSILSVFSRKDLKNKENLYKKLDTHLQPRGSYEIFSHILGLIFNFISGEKEFNKEMILKGDLSDRILGNFIYDKFYETENDEFMSDRINVETFHGVPGKHTGQYSVWNNPSAPVKKKVIAFGNSFFGNCLDQGCLGWWFSNYLENFYCVWSSNIDFDLVEKEKPDLVICQTAERFMNIVPQY